MLQDHQGYLWIGTEDGLNRFDGYEFLQFGLQLAGRSGLADGGIVSLRQGKDGHLWIGTITSGLYSLDPESGFVTHCGSGTSAPLDLASRIRSLSADSSGLLWVVGELSVFRQLSGCNFEAVMPDIAASKFVR